MVTELPDPTTIALPPLEKVPANFLPGESASINKELVVVEIESLEAALASTEFIFIGFKEISQEAYLKVVK